MILTPTRWGVLGVLLVVAASCSSSTDVATTATTSTTTSQTTTTSQVTTTTELVTATTSSATSTPTAAQTVLVYLSTGEGTDCAEVSPFERSADGNVDPVRAALDQLVSGPTDTEAASGASSFFSAETAGMVLSTELDGDLLIVDFDNRTSSLNNASTSCGSAAFLSQLNTTVFQFDSINRVRYSFNGSCEAFMNWLQGSCVDFFRDGTSVDLPIEIRADGSGCASGDGPLGDGRWFGYVESTADAELVFDLACWFTGIAAYEAALGDGAEVPPPNDYYIRNQNPVSRVLAVAADASVLWLPQPGDPASAQDASYEVWQDAREGRPFEPGVWLVTEDGLVVSVEEQYQP